MPVICLQSVHRFYSRVVLAFAFSLIGACSHQTREQFLTMLCVSGFQILCVISLGFSFHFSSVFNTAVYVFYLLLHNFFYFGSAMATVNFLFFLLILNADTAMDDLYA